MYCELFEWYDEDINRDKWKSIVHGWILDLFMYIFIQECIAETKEN